MKINLENLNLNKIIIITVFCFVFALIITTVFASLTLNSTNITSDGALTLTPGTWTLTLPTTTGTTGQFLQTDGSGVTTWATPSTSSTFNGTVTTTVDGLGNGPATNAAGAAFVSRNTTAGILGTTEQWSPPIQMIANGWDTDDAISRNVDFYWTVRPQTGNTVSGLLWLNGRVGTGGYTQALMQINNSGNMTVSGGYVATTNYSVAGKSVLQTATDGFWRMSNNAGSGFSGLQYGSSVLVDSFLLPSMGAGSSGFGTSPVLVAGHDLAFQWNVGTGSPGSTGTLTMGGVAANGWSCGVTDVTNNATANTVQSASTTTTVTVVNYSRTTGIAAAWAASDKLNFLCRPF